MVDKIKKIGKLLSTKSDKRENAEVRLSEEALKEQFAMRANEELARVRAEKIASLEAKIKQLDKTHASKDETEEQAKLEKELATLKIAEMDDALEQPESSVLLADVKTGAKMLLGNHKPEQVNTSGTKSFKNPAPLPKPAPALPPKAAKQSNNPFLGREVEDVYSKLELEDVAAREQLKTDLELMLGKGIEARGMGSINNPKPGAEAAPALPPRAMREESKLGKPVMPPRPMREESKLGKEPAATPRQAHVSLDSSQQVSGQRSAGNSQSMNR